MGEPQLTLRLGQVSLEHMNTILPRQSKSVHEVREERDPQVFVSAGHGTTVYAVSMVAETQQFSWNVVPHMLQFIVLCDTESTFGEFGRVILGTAWMGAQQGHASVTLDIVNTGGYHCDKNGAWLKGQLYLHDVEITSTGCVGELDQICASFSHISRGLKQQYRGALQSITAAAREFGDYHVLDYPHPYFEKTRVPLFLALGAGPGRLRNNGPTVALFERLVDCALHVESVSEAAFMATKLGGTPDGISQDALAVVSRMLTIYCISRPYIYDACGKGTKARHKHYTAAQFGEMDTSIVQGVDGVVSFNGGGPGVFPEITGDCEDGVLTVQLLLSGMRMLADAGQLGSARLQLAWDILSQYCWVNNVAYCGDNGTELDFTTDNGICHAICTGINKASCWRAMLLGFDVFERHRGVSPWTAEIKGRLRVLLQDVPHWVEKLQPICLETTNMVYGPLGLIGDAFPEDPRKGEALRASFDARERWWAGRECSIPTILQQWMTNCPHDHIDMQTPCNRGAFRDDPQHHRLYKFYEYVISCTMYGEEQALWAGTGKQAVHFLYTDTQGKTYGRYLQSLALGKKFALVPTIVVEDEDAGVLETVGWDMGFPVVFSPEEHVPVAIEHRPQHPFFDGMPLYDGDAPEDISFYIRKWQLMKECRRELVALGGSVDYWRMNTTAAFPLYKVSIWGTGHRRHKQSLGVALNIHEDASRAVSHSISVRTGGIFPARTVTELDLSGYKLKPSQLETLSGMRGLVVLKLKACDLGYLTDDLPPMLQILDVSHNFLRALPRGLLRLHRLREFSAHHNYIIQLPPSFWYSLPQLLRVYLQHNSLGWTGDFCNKARLQTLYIAHNFLSRIPDSITRCASLTTLDLHHNRLTELPRNMGLLQNLVTLDVSHNKLRDLPISLSDIMHTMDLKVSDNRADFKIPSALERTQALFKTTILLR